MLKGMNFMVCELCTNKTVWNKPPNQLSPSHLYNHVTNKGEACLERANYWESLVQITNLPVIFLVSLT